MKTLEAFLIEALGGLHYLNCLQAVQIEQLRAEVARLQGAATINPERVASSSTE
jgi:hypothetical protein